jgi:hypothetical protein
MALARALSQEPEPSRIVAYFAREGHGVVETAALYRKGRQNVRRTRPSNDPMAVLRDQPPMALIRYDTIRYLAAVL